MNLSLTSNTTTSAKGFAGGAGCLAARGTFGSGTLTLQWCRYDDATATSGNWINVGVSGSLCQLTAAGIIGFTLPPGFLRASLSGATNPSIELAIDSAVRGGVMNGD